MQMGPVFGEIRVAALTVIASIPPRAAFLPHCLMIWWIAVAFSQCTRACRCIWPRQARAKLRFCKLVSPLSLIVLL